MGVQVSELTTSKMNRRSLLKRAGLIGIGLPAAGVLLNTYGSGQLGTAERVKQASGGQMAIASTEVAELTISAVNLAFEPKDVSVAAGQKVRLTFINNGAIEHDWDVHGMAVDGLTVIEKPATLNQRMADLLAQAEEAGRPYAAAMSNERMVIEFTPAVAGTFEMSCMVPGHKEAGMVGTFTVTGGKGVASSGNTTANADPHAEPQTAADPYLADRLPLPVVAPPVGMREPQLVKQEITIREVIGYMDDGVAYEFWTFDGTIPGPMLRVRVGDTVELKLNNPPESKLTHNIDLHAVTGPGGGAEATVIAPGQTATFRFKALNPGVFVYHCAVPPIPQHISNGMYGLIVVEPEGGLPEVDREFYVMQGDFYLEGARGTKGLRPFSMDKLLDERPDYVAFNGSVGSVTGERAFKAQVGETVRIFFGVGGPNLVSSFHVIGEIFDRVMREGASEWATNVQTTLVPAGGATIVDFKVDVPGTLLLVDHSLGRLAKGAVGQIVVEGEANPEVFEVVEEAH